MFPLFRAKPVKGPFGGGRPCGDDRRRTVTSYPTKEYLSNAPTWGKERRRRVFLWLSCVCGEEWIQDRKEKQKKAGNLFFSFSFLFVFGKKGCDSLFLRLRRTRK
jgi:hypothetical protein